MVSYCFCFHLHFSMTYDIEHLFICLFAIFIHISFLVRYLVRFSAFLIILFVFLLLSFIHLTLHIYIFRIHRFNQPQMENMVKKKKKIQKVPKCKLEFALHRQLFTWHLHCIYNYLHSIYIVLSIASNLKVFQSIQEDVLCKY